MEELTEKYAALEDEFRMALHIEAKRFTEVTLLLVELTRVDQNKFISACQLMSYA